MDRLIKTSLRGVKFAYIMSTDILYLDDETKFEDELDGVQIHAECLSQDFDDIAWEPELDNTPSVDPNDDKFGFYD